MCGFVSMVGISGAHASVETLEKMSASIRHRGPDGRGSYVDGRVGFGFRRLSILDLSIHGHQPMFSDDRQTVIVFNGEIYNYIELREELCQLGHTFRSSGDTEVLLNAYLQWGKDCLKKLNGMWAFLIYDRRARVLFGSRDRFGIKPLYFVRTPEWMLFASEIKAIRASGLYEPSPNWKLASRYLLEDHLSVPNDNKETLYRDVSEVPAGSAFLLGLDGNMREWTYWTLDDEPSTPPTDPREWFAELFQDSVRLRMRSDVPVGVCLSGGLDSTSIICHMANDLKGGDQRAEGALQAFSYTASEFDEMPQILATVEQTGAELHRLSLDPCVFWDRMSEVAHFQDEPYQSMNVVVGYELYRIAAQNGVKVILNGQGADETLGGYPSYFRDYWYSLLKSGKLRECWREIGEYTRVHHANRKGEFVGQLRHFLQTQLARLRPYRHLARWNHRKRLQANSWFTRDLVAQFDPEVRPFEDLTLGTSLRNSVRYSPLPLYLRVEDRNSMAHSVEARLPFLDYRLVQLAFALADNMKLRGPWNKFILRESMKGRIPDVVRERATKMGFPVPQAEWFSNSLYAHLRDLLSSKSVAERGIYRMDEILRAVSAHHEGKLDVSARVLRIVQFELFCRLIENRRPVRLEASPGEARVDGQADRSR